MTEIRDKKNLKRIGWALLAMAIGLSIGWSLQDGRINLVPFLLLGGFYGFVWLMAWLLRNNP